MLFATKLKKDILDELASSGGVPFRATFAEAVAELATGVYFSCSETGSLRMYKRTAGAPGYMDQGDSAAPASRQNVIELLGDANLILTEGGDAPAVMHVYQMNDAGRKARHLFKPAGRGSHVGEQFSFIGAEVRPTGSGANGPANADIAMNVSIIKDGAGVGEIDALNIVVRQAGAGSDACAILADVAGWKGGTGFWGQLEGTTKHIQTDGTVLKEVRTQIGIVDTVNDSEFGYYAHAVTGTIDLGLFLRSQGGSFTEFIRCQKDSDVLFGVNGDGMVRMGTFSTSVDAPVNGYITIKTRDGATRKIPTIA